VADDRISVLKRELEAEMNMMTSVSTGGPRIQEVDAEFQKRRREIRTLLQRVGLEDPNPHIDLWAWYGKWSRDLPTSGERRAHVREMYEPVLARLDELEKGHLGSDLEDLAAETGWSAVDGQTAQLRVRLATLGSSEDAQAVGLLCRDIMISLAQAMFDPEIHGEVGTSAVDQLNAVIEQLAPSSENEKLRRLLKTTIDFANVVQHRRGIGMADAGLIAEATMSAVNLMRRLGARDTPG
jgi:hypothetical protein